jgi:hypothetical protein
MRYRRGLHRCAIMLLLDLFARIPMKTVNEGCSSIDWGLLNTVLRKASHSRDPKQVRYSKPMIPRHSCSSRFSNRFSAMQLVASFSCCTMGCNDPSCVTDIRAEQDKVDHDWHGLPCEVKLSADLNFVVLMFLME